MSYNSPTGPSIWSSHPAVTALMEPSPAPNGERRGPRCVPAPKTSNRAQKQLVQAFARTRRRVFRAWELKENLRYLYRVDYDLIRPYLKAWITSALRSRITAFQNLAKTIRNHFDGICAAAEEGLSNSRLEGINSKIRLIQRRGYGYHSLEALAASIYLCLGGITVKLPTQP